MKTSGGFSNVIWVVERRITVGTNDTDPMKVVLRKGTGSDYIEKSIKSTMGVIPYTMELVVVSKLSDLGLCPKVYGIFAEGRVEEFVDSTLLSLAHDKDPLVKRDLALNFARIHAADVPIAKVPQNMFKSVEGILEFFRRDEKDSFLTSEHLLKAGVKVHRMVDYDYERELEWLKGAFGKIDFQRAALSLLDVNYNNCLYRNNPQPGELKVLLIDYEMVSYRYRGFDLFGHLMQRMINHEMREGDNRDITLSGDSYPSEDEMRQWLQIYLDEVKRLGAFDDFDENGIDSVDHVLGEVELCGMLYILWSILITISVHRGIAPMVTGVYVSLFNCSFLYDLIHDDTLFTDGYNGHVL